MDVEAAARLLESYASQHGLTRAERDAVLDRIATRRRDSCQETGVPADILDWQRRTRALPAARAAATHPTSPRHFGTTQGSTQGTM